MSNLKSYKIQANVFSAGEASGKKGDVIELPEHIGDQHLKPHVKGKPAPLVEVKSK
jgi:hypothetical protein